MRFKLVCVGITRCHALSSWTNYELYLVPSDQGSGYTYCQGDILWRVCNLPGISLCRCVAKPSKMYFFSPKNYFCLQKPFPFGIWRWLDICCFRQTRIFTSIIFLYWLGDPMCTFLPLLYQYEGQGGYSLVRGIDFWLSHLKMDLYIDRQTNR